MIYRHGNFLSQRKCVWAGAVPGMLISPKKTAPARDEAHFANPSLSDQTARRHTARLEALFQTSLHGTLARSVQVFFDSTPKKRPQLWAWPFGVTWGEPSVPQIATPNRMAAATEDVSAGVVLTEIKTRVGGRAR